MKTRFLRRASARPTRIAAGLLLVGLLAIPVAVSAAHRFDDVPDTNVFHDDISWLADNGITLGCNPPANNNFCPESNVTRQQMAAFMRRLATGGVVDAATAADAAKLGGQDPYHYTTVMVSSAGSFIDFTQQNLAPGETVIATTANITVPGPGVLLIANTSSWDYSGTEDVIHSWVELDTTPGCDPAYFGGAPITGSFSTDTVDPSDGRANTSGSSAIEVPAAGTYSIHHCLQDFSGNGGVNLDHALRVQWYPTGSATIANPPSPLSTPDKSAVDGSSSQR